MRNVIILLLVVVVGGLGYLFMFQRDTFMGYLGMAKGYGPAKTPDDALQKFQKAVKERDYANASKYCSGPYGEQLNRSADVAGKLGKAIDGVTAAAEKRDIALTDKVKGWLAACEPFPAKFEAGKIEKHGDDRATVALNFPANHKIVAEMKQEGEGDAKSWKLHMPTTPWLPKGVNHLLDKGKDYAKALEKVSDQIRSKEITTKTDLEQKLEEELKAAGKD
ncbi:MAG: hypothetical protein K2R98_28870 [Gemmataceae bacterium]|nr:hypothetical protein [Gemmataceae bacterium]